MDFCKSSTAFCALISLGYTNKDIYDLLNVLREVDGVTLLDANANVETLTQSLSDLGLAAQDGVEVTINADGLAELMSQLNFTYRIRRKADFLHGFHYGINIIEIKIAIHR